MSNPHDHGGQQGGTQQGTDNDKSKVANKEKAKKGDPDNPSDTTGATKSGDENKGAK